MESRLRESRKPDALILNTAMDAIVSLDRWGKIVDWNRQAERIFGFSPTQAIGKSLPELIVPGEIRSEQTTWTNAFVPGAEPQTLCRRFKTTAGL